MKKEDLEPLRIQMRQAGVPNKEIDGAFERFISDGQLIDWATSKLSTEEAKELTDKSFKLAGERYTFWKENGGAQILIGQLAKFHAEGQFPTGECIQAFFYSIALIDKLFELQIDEMSKQK